MNDYRSTDIETAAKVAELDEGADWDRPSRKDRWEDDQEVSGWYRDAARKARSEAQGDE